MADHLLLGQGPQIARALMSLQADIEKRLKGSVPRQLKLERTSVVAGSSIFDDQQKKLSQRAFHINRVKNNAECIRAIESFKSCSRPDKHTYLMPPEYGGSSGCDVCARRTSRKCDVCNKGYFCSIACQEKRSGRHLFACSKPSITSAVHLWNSLADDLLPNDEEVLDDFSFNKFVDLKQIYPFGVYRGIYLDSDSSAEQLHEWRIGDTLVAKINEFYLGIPKEARGQYFPWFQENSHALESSFTKKDATHAFVQTMYGKARPYLEIEDRDTPVKALVPEAKALSFQVLAQELLFASPSPINDDWYMFGFVTCCNHDEESILVNLYRKLLSTRDDSLFSQFISRGVAEPATFTQFWRAFEAGTLIELFDAKGLRSENLRDPVSFPGGLPI
ncbi:hypothetical protein NX059_010208 [Plenodomus lindquistii]|nr:hypothetical protein NX059_010208 [Plenodomus lindquistii]